MLDKIRRNRELFLEGSLRCIPFRNAPRLTSYFPGIIKGMFDAITGNSSTGKTTVAKHLYVFNAIEFAIEYNLDLKILYFALEEGEEQFDYSLYSYLVNKVTGLRLNIRDFESFTQPIEEDYLRIIEQHNIDRLFEQYKSYIVLDDKTYKSYPIYRKIWDFAESRGKFYMAGEPMTDAKHWDEYVPNNPEEFIIVIVDHVSELHLEEKQASIRDAIDDITRYLRHYVTKRFDYNVLAIHQQMAAKEDVEHKKENFIRASLQGLGKHYTEILYIVEK